MYLRDGRAPIPKNELTSKIMSSICAKNTQPELKLRKALAQHGLSGYRLHLKNTPGRPDIGYIGRKIAIFVNGCYWHRCPKCSPLLPKTNKKFWAEKFARNIARDKQKEVLLRKAGWKVLIFWECQIKKDMNRCVLKVKKLLKAN